MAAAADDTFAGMTAAIEDGDFEQITSVPVAQHGTIIYQRYFDDGGAEARRNMRLATWTVTGMLAGLAIKDGSLSGVDAKVLAQLARKAGPAH